MLENFLNAREKRLNKRLHKFLALPESQLHKAMRYAVFSGGKRLRPLLVYAVGEALGAHLKILDYPACAVELVHASSLIHDDLPLMDDDDWRRGKPSCHKKFGPATALLAGNALNLLAMELLAKMPCSSKRIGLELIKLLTKAIGSQGMQAGQELDLAIIAQNKKCPLAKLEKIYQLKTGALITASILSGAIAAGLKAGSKKFKNLEEFGMRLGLAFQIQDDIIDFASEKEKLTYPRLTSLAQAKKRVCSLRSETLAALNSIIKQNDILTSLIERIVDIRY